MATKEQLEICAQEFIAGQSARTYEFRASNNPDRLGWVYAVEHRLSDDGRQCVELPFDLKYWLGGVASKVNGDPPKEELKEDVEILTGFIIELVVNGAIAAEPQLA